MWRIKRRRTKPKVNKENTGVIYPKFNATAKPNRYVNRNTYLDVKCNRNKGAGCTIIGCQCSTDASGNTYCCKTTPYRNPILGYRKHLLDCPGNTDNSGCGYTNDVSGNIYKDNYAKSCANSLVCYNPVIKRTQNRNGCVNESYNYSTNQYLTRRCLTFPQQEFNFQSQVPVDASGCCTKFMSCANCQYDSSGMCDCSSNGFCTGINKLPCEVKNTKCFAIYKRSNSKFNKQGAVSGGSRINRLKYQTRVVAAQRRKANGRNNVINRRGPAALYTTSRPPQMNAPGCWLNKDRTRSGLAQRCIVTNPCCPTTSGGVGACCDETLPEGVIKICCGFSPVSSTNPDITWDDMTIGFLKDAHGPYPVPGTWNKGLGSDFDYPLSIGTLCPPTAQYTPGALYDIGGFAWQPGSTHLWFFLSGYNFSGLGPGASGNQFDTIEFSSLPSFPPSSSITLSGMSGDYNSNALNEVHWETISPGWNWFKLLYIFGTPLSYQTKSVYIKITYL
jgi:hypothetical protein